jgi:hypothetical protein
MKCSDHLSPDWITVRMKLSPNKVLTSAPRSIRANNALVLPHKRAACSGVVESLPRMPLSSCWSSLAISLMTSPLPSCAAMCNQLCSVSWGSTAARNSEKDLLPINRLPCIFLVVAWMKYSFKIRGPDSCPDKYAREDNRIERRRSGKDVFFPVKSSKSRSTSGPQIASASHSQSLPSSSAGSIFLLKQRCKYLALADVFPTNPASLRKRSASFSLFATPMPSK